MMRHVSDLYSAHRGEEIIIIAPGVSMAGFPWPVLNGKITIAVNLAVQAPHTFTYWCVVDELAKFGFFDRPDASKTLFISRHRADDPAYYYSTVYGQRFSIRLGQFKYSSRALPIAIQFALMLGAEQISLLGCDFYRMRDQHYFCEDTPKHRVSARAILNEQDDGTCVERSLVETMKNVARLARSGTFAGARIINYSERSLLDAFERRSQEEFVRKRTLKPESDINLPLLRNARKGKGVVLICCGTSLCKFDWSSLDGLYTVALNRAIYNTKHKPTFWFHTESTKVFERMERRVTKITKHVSFRSEDRPDYRYSDARHLPSNIDKYQAAFEKGTLWVNKTCGVGGLEFCRFLGASRVAILGLDLYCTKSGRVYFNETLEPAWRYRHPVNVTLADGRWYPEIWQTVFNHNLCRGAKDIWRDMQIVNYSKDSLCSAFPVSSYDEFARMDKMDFRA